MTRNKPTSTPAAPAASPLLSDSVLTHKHVVPASHGHAIRVKADSHFRIVDLHGEQVIDLMAWVLPPHSKSQQPTEKLSMAYTRFHLSGATPAIGETLVSNLDNPLLKIVKDTVKTHDMTFMSCNPSLYEQQGLHGHRSCAENIAEVMEPYGLSLGDIRGTDPFNVFQNTPYYTLKPLGCSRAGDFIEMKALADLVVAVSCCPYDVGGFNGGKVTDIAIITGS